MSPTTNLILGLRRILCREATMAARAELDRLQRALPVLLLVGGLALFAALVLAVLGFADLAAGHGSPVIAMGSWTVAAGLGFLARPFAARLGELGHLPRWRARQIAGELLFTATLLAPGLALMAAGGLWFLGRDAPTTEALGLGLGRLGILALGCLTAGWAGLAGRGLRAGAVLACSGGAVGLVHLPHPGWAGLALAPLLLPWIWRSAPPAGPGWRLPRTGRPALGVLGQLLRERPSETGLRLAVGSLIALLGWYWLETVPAESRPLALIFLAGLVGLAIHGLVHLATGFRAARRDLVDVLPIAPWRWFALGAVLPLGYLTVLALGLGAWLVATGAASGPVLLALVILLAQGAVTVWLVHRAPSAGGLLATILHIAVIRGAVAVVR